MGDVGVGVALYVSVVAFLFFFCFLRCWVHWMLTLGSVVHLLLLGLLGLTFKRLGELTMESGVSSAPKTGEVVGVADAPRDKWPPLS